MTFMLLAEGDWACSIIAGVGVRDRRYLKSEISNFKLSGHCYNAYSFMAKKVAKIKIEKEKLRPRERAPILPSKKIEDKRTRAERREKHKKDLRRITDES
jgi:hypothetical protein